MSLTSFLGKAAAAAALLLASLSLQQAPASAAPAAPQPATSQQAACWGQGCAGQDPQSSGCAASGYTVESFYAHWGDFVELRHSWDCGAYWTRVTANSDNRPYRTATQSGRDNGTVIYEHTVSGNCWPNGTGAPCAATWTPMVAGALIRTCHNADVLNCTAWRVTSSG
ncbi:YjfA family protein [Crossiella sp. SN42]|uniref:DUF2690 domain-containing protein n=1 Tax=Crossiella sp. SN42 TaxID=2944808 RepID=UPI00207CA70A|nr:DUF2690 domain-containing protein [Crossiella sp. SN42]MCO1580965.1 YjfA family protein [Crossiella sp. SN42]